MGGDYSVNIRNISLFELIGCNSSSVGVFLCQVEYMSVVLTDRSV